MEAGEELGNEPLVLELLTKQPDRLGVRDPVFKLQSQETHEGKTISDLIFNTVIRQIVQLLQDQYLEHQYNIDWLCSRIALAFFFMHQTQILAKRFPIDTFVQSNQWISHLGQLRGSIRNVKKAWMFLLGHRYTHGSGAFARNAWHF